MGHVVVELVAVGANVHAEDGAVELVGAVGQLRLDELEVGHRLRIVVFDGIGVEADELHPSGNEGEVGIAEHLAVGFFAGAQTVVIAQQDDVRHVELVQNVALPQKFVGEAEVARVAAMNHEVDVVAAVEVLHEVFGFVVPSLRVAHDGNAQRGLVPAIGFNQGNVMVVDIGFSADADVVGVVVDELAAAQSQQQAGHTDGLEGLHTFFVAKVCISVRLFSSGFSCIMVLKSPKMRIFAKKRRKNMKNRLNYSLLRIVFALVMGLVLVLFPAQAGNYLVITVGVLFLVPALISIVAYFTESREMRSFFPILSVGSLLFGLWLIIMPEFFADLLTYVLGFILAMGGVQQIASLLSARKWMTVPAGFYVVPSLILLAGLFALFNPLGVLSTIFVVIGASCLVYACSELLNWFKFIRRRPKADWNGKLDKQDIDDAEVVE